MSSWIVGKVRKEGAWRRYGIVVGERLIGKMRRATQRPLVQKGQSRQGKGRVWHAVGLPGHGSEKDRSGW